MCFHINDDKLLGKHEAIWTKIEDLKNIELNALPVYDYRYIKTKIRTYSGQVYNNFRGLNVPEYSNFYWFLYEFYWFAYENKYYPQAYLDNCTYKIIDKEMTDPFGKNSFETVES